MRKKIGIIVQRYGSQINGGAEVYAKMIAERLNNYYDVTVLTSRAIDYHTWAPELPLGESEENKVRIIRFDHPPKGNLKEIHQLNRKLRGRLWYQKLYRFLGKPNWYLHIFPDCECSEKIEEKYLALQGPYIFDLSSYLLQEKDNYDAFIFITYLYYPAAACMAVVAEKSIFIPTLHDEPSAHMKMFQKIIPSPAWILFLTNAELDFAVKTYNLSNNKKDIVGVGMEMPDLQKDTSYLGKYDIEEPYVIYVGRIDRAKGCDVFISNFIKFINEHKSTLTLIMVGKNMIEEIRHPRIKYAGFVSDEDKSQLMKQAKLLIMPSPYESLSLVLLESFTYKVPVLANAECAVLKEHIEISKGGYTYSNYQTFSQRLNEMISDDHRIEIMGQRGYDYVQKNYIWNVVIDKFKVAIEDIAIYQSN
jgi:glycosyltransferase involved in cell wall biosynthesis